MHQQLSSKLWPGAALVVCLALLAGGLSANPLSEEAKINLLINHVEQSGHHFIRGGSEYNSRDAAAHMRMKWNRAGKSRINTARRFIKYIASESYLLGTPYYIKYADGRKVKSADYLLARLREIEVKQ